MLRVVLALGVVVCLLGVRRAIAECWYGDETHPENAEVPTAEPCLNCTCSKGALLCYLRICPSLPNPPPPGCILLHKYHTCCPELICTDLLKDGNSVEARSDIGQEVDFKDGFLENACVVNGSIYGPGSAMDSSSLCEYCYCLGGKQICIKPKCLLPIDHCQPIYDPSSCCPSKYDCSTSISTTTATTRDGCTVDDIYYKEGGKVLGVGHSACDNCYCLKGVLRCEPLSCAPPLFGCNPVLKEGECCAISYNCSGVFETKPEPNYGAVPIISKEYAKLHKEMFGTETDLDLRTTKVQRNSDFGTTRYFVHSTVVPVPNSIEEVKEKQNLSNFIDFDESTTEYEKIETTTAYTTDSTTEFATEESTETTTSDLVTLQTVLNSTDCILEDVTIQLTTSESTKSNESETLESKNTSKTDLIFELGKNKNDYDYDYNEPTLPPSLPNVRIIPFVAADALDSENTDHNIIYSKDSTDSSMGYHLFSPPVETEGGFVPKEPPMLDNFYDNIITSTTSFPKLQMSCTINNKEVPHGELVPSETSCSTCSCFYGNVVCQNVDCPLPKLNCVKTDQIVACCPLYVCDDKITSPDPLSLDKVLSLLFSQDSTTKKATTPLSTNAFDDGTSNVAILKLAGCNIYGRMYRVGRIISELSNSCLECRCTETGVQCKDLDC